MEPMLYSVDGGPPATLEEIIQDNSDVFSPLGQAEIDQIAALDPGAVALLGGGAFGEVGIARVR